MSEARKKCQELLRELFQFDCADLDFGIYRIMNQKRDLIEQFIEKDLLNAVGKELNKGILRERGDLAEQLATLASKIREDIADDAIDADGRLAEAHKKTKLGKQYLELQGKAAAATTNAELEALVFNHLWAFFSRYYDNGDFFSTRRYSRREKYVIPYNGEEIYFHWANRNQYYIKTGESFTDYQWNADDMTVIFKLLKAETEKDNVKSDTKRLFVPLLEKLAVDGKVMTLPFEYRGLTEQEGISFGKKNQQEAIISTILESLPKRKALREAPAAVLAAIMAEYRKTYKGDSVSRLEHHLRRYTGKNTRDYFIHKDLEGFLTQELDFYLKNEVLALDDLASGGEARANGWFQLLEAMRVVGGKIIAFLAQIENFQKRIFEKRKFVTETNYCFTLDRVPKALKPKILKNKAQIEEWKKLYSVQDLKGYSDPLKPAFLESWPSLIMDTRYFANDIEFMDTLLAAQKDLEESLDGLLVNSENFQALNFVFARYRNSLNTVYIDPPYNTDASSILYKNDYKHSSWMSLIENRLTLSSRLMTNTGILCCAIDDEELTEARHILGQFFPKQLGIAVVRSNPQSRKAKGKFSPVHEYALFYGKSEDSTPGSLELTEKRIARYPKQDEQGRFAWMNLIRTGTNDKRMDRPKLYYPIFVADDDTPRIPQMSWSDDAGEYGEYILHETAKQNETVVYPIDETEDGPIEKNWHRGYKRILAEPDEYRVRRDAKGKINIDFKTRIDEHSTPVTWWDNNEYASANYGAVELKGLFGAKPFDFPKALNLVADCLRAANTRFNSVVLDYFAGSGTTGHAVINLNREDGGRRKYILIEMGEYFDAVLIARMKKVVFCPHWRDGKPVPPDEHKSTGLSHAFKYFRLESYEDALGNMFSGPQGNLKFDDYVLQYILGFETRKSETLLNVEKLTAPFLYKLDIMEGGERKTKPVDLPETFNYLLGLKVHSREVHRRDGKHRYLVFRGTSNPYGEGGERKLCVIWRDVSEWKSADFKADAEFVKKEKLADGADDVFVNADSVIPGARVLDSVFKERMFMPVAV